MAGCRRGGRPSIRLRSPPASPRAPAANGRGTALVVAGLRRFLVCGFVHQVRRRRAGEVYLHDPALAVRIRVHELGMRSQVVIDNRDRSIHWRIEIARGLHRFDDPEGLTLAYLATRL